MAISASSKPFAPRPYIKPFFRPLSKRSHIQSRPREKYYLSESQRQAIAAERRIEAKNQEKQRADAEAQFLADVKNISDEEAQSRIDESSESDQEKITRLAYYERRAFGYYRAHQTSALWAAARRRVMKKLIAAGLCLWEIEEGDPCDYEYEYE